MSKEIYKAFINELRGKNSQPPEDILDRENYIRHENEKRELANKARRQLLRLQNRWSWIIGGVLGISTLSTWGMVFLIGLGYLDFEKYPLLPHTAMGTFFGEVVALGLVVAKCLFPQSDKSI